MTIMKTFVRLNGYVDIVYGLCIIGILNLPIISSSYAGIFSYELDELTKRLLGYYILLQGCIRIKYKPKKNDLVLFSYIMEAIIFSSELWLHKSINIKHGYCIIMYYTLIIPNL